MHFGGEGRHKHSYIVTFICSAHGVGCGCGLRQIQRTEEDNDRQDCRYGWMDKQRGVDTDTLTKGQIS